jgi:hypothetical protein
MSDNSIFVISNGSVDSYPNNTLTNFKNKLPKILEFTPEQKYEVSVEGIGFSCQFRNIHLPKKDFPSFLISNCYHKEFTTCKDFAYCPIDVHLDNTGGLTYRAALGVPSQLNVKCKLWEYRFLDKLYEQTDVVKFLKEVNEACNVDIIYEDDKISFSRKGFGATNYWLMLHPTMLESFNIVLEYVKSGLETKNAKYFNNITRDSSGTTETSILTRDYLYKGSEKYLAFHITQDVPLKGQKSKLSEIIYPSLVKVVSKNIQPQILNSSFSNDLIVFCPDFSKGYTYFFHEFVGNQFLPLSNSILSTIDIKLCDQNNDEMQLLPGHATIIKLKLKPMENNNNFHLRLTSEKTSRFPDNTNSAFDICLPSKLKLNRNWRVNLTTINFPNTFSTFLATTDRSIYVHTASSRYEINIPNLLYTEDTLIACLKEKLSSKNIANVERDSESKKLHFTFMEPGLFVFPHTLAKMLGFQVDSEKRKQIYIVSSIEEENSFVTFNPEKMTKHKLDANNECLVKCENYMNLDYLKPNYIILYASFISPSIVGSKYSQILRVVPIKPKLQEYVLHEFKHKEYFELQNTELSELRLELRSHDGEFINFANEKDVILNVEFAELKS